LAYIYLSVKNLYINDISLLQYIVYCSGHWHFFFLTYLSLRFWVSYS